MCKRLKIVPKPGHVLFIGTHNRICARRRALSAATRCDAKAVAGDESSSTAPRLQSRMVARRFCASATHWPLWRYRKTLAERGVRYAASPAARDAIYATLPCWDTPTPGLRPSRCARTSRTTPPHTYAATLNTSPRWWLLPLKESNVSSSPRAVPQHAVGGGPVPGRSAPPSS